MADFEGVSPESETGESGAVSRPPRKPVKGRRTDRPAKTTQLMVPVNVAIAEAGSPRSEPDEEKSPNPPLGVEVKQVYESNLPSERDSGAADGSDLFRAMYSDDPRLVARAWMDTARAVVEVLLPHISEHFSSSRLEDRLTAAGPGALQSKAREAGSPSMTFAIAMLIVADSDETVRAELDAQEKCFLLQVMEGIGDLLPEIDIGFFVGVHCCMFLTPSAVCGPPGTLRRICSKVHYLHTKAFKMMEWDVEEAAELREVSIALQQAAVSMVESLELLVQEALWYVDEECDILKDFLLADARTFIARPRLQHVLRDMWHPDYEREDIWDKVLNQMWLFVSTFCGLMVVMIPTLLYPDLERLWYRSVLQKDLDIRHIEDLKGQDVKDIDAKKVSLFTGQVSKQATQRMSAKQKKHLEDERRMSQRKALTKLWLDFGRAILLPRQKKYLAIVTNLAFLVALVYMEPTDFYISLVFILGAGALYAELAQLFGRSDSDRLSRKQRALRSFRLWWMDKVNVAELCAFGCLCFSCVIRYVVLDWVPAFRAAGVFFMGLSQTVKLLRLSSVYGPLVSMVVQMIIDVLRWVVVMLPILFSLVLAFTTLTQKQWHDPDKIQDKPSTKPECRFFHPEKSDLLTGIILFFEVPIGLSAPFECVDNMNVDWIAPALLNGGLWIIIVLMLNMLIAMMAKTFDAIFEQSMLDYQFKFAMFVIQMRDEPAVPPVLRLLGLPYALASGAYHHAKRVSDYASSTASESEKPLSGVRWHGCLSAAFWEEAQERFETEQEGKAEPRPKWQRPSKIVDIADELRKASEEFMNSHFSDSSFQEGFRKQMAQKIMRVDAKVDEMSYNLAALVKHQKVIVKRRTTIGRVDR